MASFSAQRKTSISHPLAGVLVGSAVTEQSQVSGYLNAYVRPGHHLPEYFTAQVLFGDQTRTIQALPFITSDRPLIIIVFLQIVVTGCLWAWSKSLDV